MATITDVPRPPCLQVICFSMDRPWQVSEYLRTLREFLGVDLSVVWVLFKASNAAFRSGYAQVMTSFPTVQWTEEDASMHAHAFGHGLLSVLAASSSEYVLFGVDDAFFFDYFPLMDVLAAPSRHAWNTLHITLNPNIWYSETQQQPLVPLPAMQSCGKDLLTFATGRGEWNYPFEVSGSVYRRSRVADVLAAIQRVHGIDGLSQPNRLEVNGDAVRSSFSWKEACVAKPVMHVMAINQVQTVYENPLLGEEVVETEVLLTFLSSPQRLLDTDRYRATVFRSVHVGALFLQDQEPDKSIPVEPPALLPLVSIVMPAYNEARFIGQAIASVLRQTYSRLEVLVLDDRSTDATASIVEAMAASDARVRLVRNPINLGVAKTLNRGIELATGDFIARMDGDDIALPNRLEMQLAFLQAHPDVDVVGAAIALIGPDFTLPSSDSSDVFPADPLKVVVYPTTCARTRWSMLMGCMLAHPTVLFRRSIRPRYRYSEALRSGEDYDLWLRLVVPPSHGTPTKMINMMSLGTPLLLHRKHGNNASTRKRDQQRQEAHDAAHAAVERLLNRPVESQVVQLLRLHTFDKIDDDHAADKLVLRHAAQAIRVLHEIARACAAEEHCNAEERAAIECDVASRHGELAFRAMMAGSDVALWQDWVQQYPVESRRVFAKLTSRPPVALHTSRADP